MRVYNTSRRQVSNVRVDGRRLLRAGRLHGLDCRAIIDRANRWREPIPTGQART